MRCYAYAYGFDFDKAALLAYLNANYQVKNYGAVCHFRIQEKGVLVGEGDVFIFPYGAIVTWGLAEAQELEIIQLLGKFQNNKLGEVDDDLYAYSYDEKIKFADDHIVLNNSDVLHKLACSHGLAQSAKLGGFEKTVQNIIENTKNLPLQLAKSGTIKLSQHEIRKLMGRIFIDRNSINLHLEFLDMPEFFWENSELEPLHEMITDYMSQERRVAILNQKLRVIQELVDMLGNELNNQHSSKLEWIIILLIFVEVVFMFAKEVFQLF